MSVRRDPGSCCGRYRQARPNRTNSAPCGSHEAAEDSERPRPRRARAETGSGSRVSSSLLRCLGSASSCAPVLRLIEPVPAEGAFCVAVGLSVVKPGEGFVERRAVSRRNPPHHEMLLREHFEPLGAALVELAVNGVPDEMPEGVDALPNREVRHETRISSDLRPGVAGAGLARALHHPDKARTALADAVHPV